MTTQNSVNANSTTPLPVSDGGTGVSSPTAFSVPIGEGTSPINTIALAAGQLLVGTTAGDPVATTITAGTGISIASTSGSIIITNTMPSAAWQTSTTSTLTLVANNGYINLNNSTPVFTLPTTAAYGTVIQITNVSMTGLVTIAQNAGQFMKFGSLTTTTGTAGSIKTTGRGDVVSLQCFVANTAWQVTSSVGNLTVV